MRMDKIKNFCKHWLKSFPFLCLAFLAMLSSKDIIYHVIGCWSDTFDLLLSWLWILFYSKIFLLKRFKNITNFSKLMLSILFNLFIVIFAKYLLYFPFFPSHCDIVLVSC